MPEQLATACERFRDNHWPRWPDKLRFLWMMTNNYCSVCEDPWFLGPPNLSAQRACSDSKSNARAFSFVTWNSSCIYLDSIESHNFSRSPDAIFTCTWCVKACTWNCMTFQISRERDWTQRTWSRPRSNTSLLVEEIVSSLMIYAVKVRRHKPWSRGPLSWIPGMWLTICQFRL